MEAYASAKKSKVASILYFFTFESGNGNVRVILKSQAGLTSSRLITLSPLSDSIIFKKRIIIFVQLISLKQVDIRSLYGSTVD